MSAANGTQRDIGLDLTRILAFLAVPSVHFFLNSIGRSFQYTDKAKVFGVGNSNPQRIELGLVYQLPVF